MEEQLEKNKERTIFFEEQKELWIRTVAKVWADEDYKNELLAHTNEVLIKEGIYIPEGMTVHIVETPQLSTPSDFYFTMPKPNTEFKIEKSEIRKAAWRTESGISLGELFGS